MSLFTVDVYQNEYLPAGGAEVHAVVTVTAMPTGAAAVGVDDDFAGGAEIVIVDTSGSMLQPRSKIREVLKATVVAIDCIRDDVAFGVIAGTESARSVYPIDGMLVAASEQTRGEAKAAVNQLVAGGGTAIGNWLALARDMFAHAPDGLRHAILLTDGKDRDETPAELAEVLASCDGVFQCDCRGVGSDWVVSELRTIASRLLGTADIVPDPAGLEADFRSMVTTAMGKTRSRVSLRLWTPQGAILAFVRQVAPMLEYLTDRATAIDSMTHEYPTGAWGNESRDYHLCVRVRPGDVGDEMLAARMLLVVDDRVIGQGLVRAIWTDNEQLSTRINREVAHYTGQAELADAIQAGLAARKAGDAAEATFKLGRAVQLAEASGNDGTMRLLERVVQVEDALTGTVRLRTTVAAVDEMTLDTRSTRTVRVQGVSP